MPTAGLGAGTGKAPSAGAIDHADVVVAASAAAAIGGAWSSHIAITAPIAHVGAGTGRAVNAGAQLKVHGVTGWAWAPPVVALPMQTLIPAVCAMMPTVEKQARSMAAAAAAATAAITLPVYHHRIYLRLRHPPALSPAVGEMMAGDEDHARHRCRR